MVRTFARRICALILILTAAGMWMPSVSYAALAQDAYEYQIGATEGDVGYVDGGFKPRHIEIEIDPQETWPRDNDSDSDLPPHSESSPEDIDQTMALGQPALSIFDHGIDSARPITRVEFAGIVVKIYENLIDTLVQPIDTNPFTDTQDADALKAYNAGIMIGVSQTSFSPDTILTREQAATALTRIFKRASIAGWPSETYADYYLRNIASQELFDDDKDISGWAREGVYLMANSGIIPDVGDNTFAPRAATTVQQAAGFAAATREQELLADRKVIF